MSYKENCLQNVIFRIDFVDDFIINETTVKKTLLEAFPVVEQEEMQGKEAVNFIAEDGTQKIQINTKKWINHIFWDRLKTKRIVISRNSVFIDVNQYDSYQSTKKLFLDAVETIKADNENAIISRIGMRYINNIDLTKFSQVAWTKYIQKNYIDAATIFLDEKSFVSSNNTVELSYEDYNLRVVFGFLNPDRPSVQKRHVFTMDFDAFTFGEMGIAEVSKFLDIFHTRIEDMFEASIKDGQRNRMGVKANE